MTPLAAVDTTVKKPIYDYTEKDAFDALYQELAKGIQSMKNGEVYTIEEAWEEIDKIQYMDKAKKYKVILSKDAVQDIKNTKTYILQTFMYREYAENFSRKIKSAIDELNHFAEGYEKTGYIIEGLEIYYKPYSTYLIFFVIEDATVTVIRVLKDRMYWQAIINRMKKINRQMI